MATTLVDAQGVAQLVNWDVAARLGRLVAGPGVAVDAESRLRMVQDFERLSDMAEGLVRGFTGLESRVPATRPRVLTRGAWVDANLSGFRALLRPVAERLPGGPRRGPARATGALVLGVQIGALLGYVGQKVLGQYDLLFASGAQGRLYFVGPNVVASERRLGFDPQDFRLWITLHEVTHRTQFGAVEWLRPHVESLVQRYLGAVTLDTKRIGELAKEIRRIIAGGPQAWRAVRLTSLLLTPDQRDTMLAMQSLMSVVEGHGNFVMDRIGAEHIASFPAMRGSLQLERSRVGAAERAVQRVIGLEMKYEQYSVGQAFFTAVEERAGRAGVNLVWERVENLPSAEELRSPSSWLERVGR